MVKFIFFFFSGDPTKNFLIVWLLRFWLNATVFIQVT